MKERNGLKDHEIAELVNLLTKRINRLSIDSLPDCLRGVISKEVVAYLLSIDKKIDKGPEA